MHGRANGRGIAFCDRRLHRFGGFQDRFVNRRERGLRLFTHRRFTGKGFVDGLAESVPEFLLEAAIQYNGMGFFLPALLQSFDGIDTQSRSGTERLRLCNQGIASLQTGFLNRLKGFVRGMDRCFPLRLQFREHFFAQVTAFAPALGELVQLASYTLPVRALGMFSGPGFEFFDQGQALGFVCSGLGAGFFEPCIDHHMGFVASRIKALPQSGIGRSLFVDFFPLLAQIAQGLLHLAATHGGN